MTDRELILAAAKAAGKLPERWRENVYYIKGLLEGWHPLDDDGEAFRLAVKLPSLLDLNKIVLEAHQYHDDEENRRAYVRRGIVRAAAEVGSRWVA